MLRPNFGRKWTNEKVFPLDSGSLRPACFGSDQVERSGLQLRGVCCTGLTTMAAIAILETVIPTIDDITIAPQRSRRSLVGRNRCPGQ